MSSIPDRASFLGLPTELRVRIYDYLVQSEVNCEIIQDIRHTCDSKGTQATLIRKQDAKLLENIPWLNVRLTCKDLDAEFKSYVSATAFLNDQRNATYTLDLEIHSSYEDPPTRSVTWRCLPCGPSSAQVLVINANTKAEACPWTEGGAASLARAIYQLLNHIVHNGPLIHRKQKLQQHMHVRDLMINIDVGPRQTNPSRGCSPDPILNLKLFISGWCGIAQTGFLTGFVDKTIVRNVRAPLWKDRGNEILTQYQKSPTIPGAWRGYGFQWGVD